MSKLAYFFWWIFLVIFAPLVVCEAWGEISIIADNLGTFFWFAIGFIVFFVINHFFCNNTRFIRTFSHEFNHTIVCLLFFRNIKSFNVEASGNGVVWHEKGGSISSVCISLAPYCLPVFTYILLILRIMIRPEFFWLFDLLIGFSVAFYIVCFAEQTGSSQTDINQYSLIFSYCYIFVFQLFNLSIILYSLLPEMHVFIAFRDLFVNYWNDIQNFLSCIF